MDIEKIKTAGIVRALRDEIRSAQFRLGKAWEGVETSGHYVGLSTAIKKAETDLSLIKELLKEIQKYYPNNK